MHQALLRIAAAGTLFACASDDASQSTHGSGAGFGSGAATASGPTTASTGSGASGASGGSSGGGPPQGTTFFAEDFEDTDFASRGWYDGAVGAITTAEFQSGASSLVCHWQQGQALPGASGQWTFRHEFPDSDRVYVSVWWKFSSNWIGSGTNYHPHLLLVLTNENADYAGPAYTHLTTYIETVFGYPRLALQDGQNIDESNINVDLVGTTENRATQGCNGFGDSYTSGASCYSVGSVHWNGRVWDGPGANLVDGNWHHIEAYFQLNTIVNGIGVADGYMAYWVDGSKIVDVPNVLMRTGQWPSMKFNQFMLAPYMQPGNGSPIDQTLWMDNLVVRDVPLGE